MSIQKKNFNFARQYKYMKYSNETALSTSSPLMQSLTSLDACLKTCITDIRSVSGFQLVCHGLREETATLNRQLNDFIEQYSHHMPIYQNEPHDVRWIDWRDKIRARMAELTKNQFFCASQISNYYSLANDVISANDWEAHSKYPFELVDELRETSNYLEETDDMLSGYNAPALFEDYCKAELQSYYTTQWPKSKRAIVRETQMQTDDACYDYCMRMIKANIQALRSIKSDLAVEETQSINHEALGRYLWGNLHNDEDTDHSEISACDIMQKVLAVDFYLTKANGCEEHVTDPQLIKANIYANQMQRYVTDKWKNLHSKLWTKILVNKEIAQKIKDVGRASFKQFCIPYVHNIICTLRNLGVYVEMGPNTLISVSAVNKNLRFEGKGDSISEHRTSLNSEVDNATRRIIESITSEVIKAA